MDRLHDVKLGQGDGCGLVIGEEKLHAVQDRRVLFVDGLVVDDAEGRVKNQRLLGIAVASFAVLFMNVMTPLIDKYTIDSFYGIRKRRV